MLKIGDMYYAYATSGAGKQVQTLTSKDLVHWQPGPELGWDGKPVVDGPTCAKQDAPRP